MPTGVYKRDKKSLERLRKIGVKKGEKCRVVYTEIIRDKIRKNQTGKNNSNWKGGKWAIKRCIDCGIEKKCSIARRCKKCKRISMTGDKHWNWQGGISTERDKIRHTIEITLWKKTVLKIDDWTCQKTGKKGGKLRVHHINNFADHPELRTSIKNGITLSEDSHKLFHKIYGKKNNTRRQLQEFLDAGAIS